MTIEFDEKWVVKTRRQLDKAISALDNGDVKKALYYIARALSNLQSGVYPTGDGWSEGVGDRLDYAATLLDDICEVLKEQGWIIQKQERGGGES